MCIYIYYFAKFINIHVSNSIILKSFFCDFRQIFAGYCLQSFGNCKERCIFAQICGKPKHFHRPCFLDKKFLAFLLWKSAGCGSVSLFFLCIRQKSAKTKPLKLTSEGRLISSFAFCSKSCAHSKIEKLWSLTATASCIFIPLSSNFRPKEENKMARHQSDSSVSHHSASGNVAMLTCWIEPSWAILKDFFCHLWQILKGCCLPRSKSAAHWQAETIADLNIACLRDAANQQTFTSRSIKGISRNGPCENAHRALVGFLYSLLTSR